MWMRPASLGWVAFFVPPVRKSVCDSRRYTCRDLVPGQMRVGQKNKLTYR